MYDHSWRKPHIVTEWLPYLHTAIFIISYTRFKLYHITMVRFQKHGIIMVVFCLWTEHEHILLKQIYQASLCFTRAH